LWLGYAKPGKGLYAWADVRARFYTPEQVQQFATAMAGWPVEPLGDEFVLLGNYPYLTGEESLSLVQALACATLQSAAWPKRVHKVIPDGMVSKEGARSVLRSLFPVAWIARI
jgi:hypothetical protein